MHATQPRSVLWTNFLPAGQGAGAKKQQSSLCARGAPLRHRTRYAHLWRDWTSCTRVRKKTACVTQPRFLSPCSFFNNCMGRFGRLRVCSEKRERPPRLSGEEKNSPIPDRSPLFLHVYVTFDFSCLAICVWQREIMWWQIFITSRRLMFDMMCWNPAVRLFTRDTQATANWPDRCSFCPWAASLAQLTVRPKHSTRRHTHWNDHQDMFRHTAASRRLGVVGFSGAGLHWFLCWLRF